MAQTLSDIRGLLAAHGLRPVRRLGQNFLHDQHQMARVVAAAGLERGELLLEVGAGTGALTERLLDAGVGLVTVEVDRRLEPILRHRLAGYGDRVRLVMGDVLAGKHAINAEVIAALRAMAGRLGGANHSFKLIANLPYNVASPLLANLATGGIDGLRMAEAVVMVQKEVADRLTASPGGKEYGALGVLIQAAYEVERVATVGPGCFWPSPKVDSAIVRLVQWARPATDNLVAMGRTLSKLFGQRRKQIGTIMGRGQRLPAGIDPQARPERLTVEQLACLSDWLDKGQQG